MYGARRIWERVQGIEAGTCKLGKWNKCAWDRKEWDRWKAGLVESQVRLRNMATRALIREALAAIERCENDGLSYEHAYFHEPMY
jgi:hypothetical protein